jgi:hypothetical protein
MVQETLYAHRPLGAFAGTCQTSAKRPRASPIIAGNETICLSALTVRWHFAPTTDRIVTFTAAGPPRSEELALTSTGSDAGRAVAAVADMSTIANSTTTEQMQDDALGDLGRQARGRVAAVNARRWLSPCIGSPVIPRFSSTAPCSYPVFHAHDTNLAPTKA